MSKSGLVVPVFWDYEIANGINKAVGRGDLTTEEGREAVRLILAVQARRVPLLSWTYLEAPWAPWKRWEAPGNLPFTRENLRSTAFFPYFSG